MEDTPKEVRRLMHGWFGQPIWGACYDDDGQVDEDMHIPVPVGQPCVWCDDKIVATDSGQAIPVMMTQVTTTIHYAHRECLLRSAVGGLDHLAGRCICYGDSTDDLGSLADGMTSHQEALAIDQYMVDRIAERDGQ